MTCHNDSAPQGGPYRVLTCMVRQMLHEHAASLSAASHTNRSRRQRMCERIMSLPRNRRIERSNPYLLTWAGEIRNVSLLVASAVNSKGYRESPWSVAQKRIFTTKLHVADLVGYFVTRPSRYDAITAAAVHFGELLDVFKAARHPLRPRGLLVFTVFAQDHDDDGFSVGLSKWPREAATYIAGHTCVRLLRKRDLQLSAWIEKSTNIRRGSHSLRLWSRRDVRN
jgi:hypothetical protein